MITALKVICMVKSAQDLDRTYELGKFPCNLSFLHANGFQSVMHEKIINLGRCRSFAREIPGKR